MQPHQNGAVNLMRVGLFTTLECLDLTEGMCVWGGGGEEGEVKG